MSGIDPHGLGYHDVDGDAHTEVLVTNMDTTARWGSDRSVAKLGAPSPGADGGRATPSTSDAGAARLC